MAILFKYTGLATRVSVEVPRQTAKPDPASRQLQKDVMPKIKQANDMMIRGISAKDLKVLDQVLAQIRENAEALRNET